MYLQRKSYEKKNFFYAAGVIVALDRQPTQEQR